MENSERPVGEIVELTNELNEALIDINRTSTISELERLISDGTLPPESIADVTLSYLKEVSRHPSDVYLVLVNEQEKLGIQNISKYKDGDDLTLSRSRGGMIHAILNKRPEYERHGHFILPIKNNNGKLRFYYKPRIGKTILQNLKNNSI